MLVCEGLAMTDAQCRRQAMQLAAQLPADPAVRRTIVDYLQQLLPFMDGKISSPSRGSKRQSEQRPAAATRRAYLRLPSG
jgi:hypothetical protein